MLQSSNGQALPQPDHSKPKRHNAKLCPIVIQQRIINALANGDSIRSIARELHVSNNTVVAIREQDWQQVAARKERIAAQCERNATLAAERMTDKLQSTDDIPLNTLVPTFGVAVDKMLALRGENALNIPHHLPLGFQLEPDHLIAYCLALSKADEEQKEWLKSVGLEGFILRAEQIRASQGDNNQRPVIEAEIVQETHLLAENTQSKKGANGRAVAK